MKEFLAEWGGVIGYVGPPLVGWLWWSVRQRFTPKEEHSALAARVTRLESDIEDMPDGQTMLKIQLALEELRGDSKRQDAKNRRRTNQRGRHADESGYAYSASSFRGENMKTFATLQAENRRCAFLRFLEAEPDYAMNTSLMQTALAAIGHGVSRDCVNTAAAWLAEQGLATTENLSGIVVVTLTQRGLDAASGRVTVQGNPFDGQPRAKCMPQSMKNDTLGIVSDPIIEPQRTENCTECRRHTRF